MVHSDHRLFTEASVRSTAQRSQGGPAAFDPPIARRLAFSSNTHKSPVSLSANLMPKRENIQTYSISQGFSRNKDDGWGARCAFFCLWNLIIPVYCGVQIDSLKERWGDKEIRG